MRELEVNLSIADIAQRILKLQGAPYSLKDYPMFLDIFNSSADRVLMRSGRQVSKTVTIAAKAVCDVSLEPYFPIIYANSSGSQTASFSTSKLDPFLIHSPIVYHNFSAGKYTKSNVFYKRLSNFSELILSYFSESADRIRGKTGNKMYLDEVQDILYDAVIDAEECLSAAKVPKFMYAGTSKTLGTTLEYFWSLSTQKEWIIKCQSCNKWNRPDMDNIGKKGLVCKNCNQLLNPFDGRWYSFSENKHNFIDGYWIPQIILPMHCLESSKWEKILEKLENYPDYKFRNEVMGLPMGEGEKPITEEILKAVAVDSLPMYSKRCPENSKGADFIVAGIDWGGGGGNGTSRTVLSVFATYPYRNEFVKIFGKIYGAGEPSKHVEDIAFQLRQFGVTMVFGDQGGGNFAMSQLRALVPDVRIVPVMYSDQGALFKWDDRANRYTVDRTSLIDNFFIDIKQKVVRTVRWSDFKPFADDIQNVYEEILNEERGKPRRVWRRYPSKPDDSLHSMVFGWFASRVISNMLDFSQQSL